jgi:hypothetical protein
MNEKPDSSIFSSGRRNFITGATAAMAAAITDQKNRCLKRRAIGRA